MRGRLYVSVTIGLASGFSCWFLLHHFTQGAADFGWAIHAAQRALAGLNPYDTPLEQYPLTAALFALPFIRLVPDVAAGCFFGISSGLLALGVTRRSYAGLVVFLAYPYWAAMITAQWSPLIMASAFFPFLLPATMAKPQIGFPVAMSHLSRRGLIACVLWALLSLAWLPRWPWLWSHQFGYYQHFIPLLVFPGPLLLLALFRFRQRNTWLLLLTACMPQRWFFDSLILWLIPKSRRQLLWTSLLSWGAGIWRWYHALHTPAQVGRCAIVFLYLPMLLVVLTAAPPSRTDDADPAL